MKPVFRLAGLIFASSAGRMLCAPLMRRWEILEVVDEKGRICGAAPRRRVHGDNTLLHRVVHVLVTDRQGRILLQKRSGNKKVAPGKWDTSVGGHIDFAETPEQAMYREMSEELGVLPDSPEFAYSYIHNNSFESELVFTYVSGFTGTITPNPEEIEKVGFWPPGRILQAAGTGVLSDNFEDEFCRYMQWSARSRSEEPLRQCF